MKSGLACFIETCDHMIDVLEVGRVLKEVYKERNRAVSLSESF